MFTVYRNGMNNLGIYESKQEAIRALENDVREISDINGIPISKVFSKTAEGITVIIYQYSTLWQEIYTIFEDM